MLTFKLEPIQEGLANSRWEATALKEGCWVLAADEANARQRVELATLVFVEVAGEGLASPWRDAGLTTCGQDEPGIELREGIIVSLAGKMFSKPLTSKAELTSGGVIRTHS